MSFIFEDVDYVVCEGTNVARPDSTLRSERELQSDFRKALRQKIGHIVYLSSTNIDRLFSLYHAALEARMLFLVDAYQKQIMDVVAKIHSLWSKSKLYQYDVNYPPTVPFGNGDDYTFNDKFVKAINDRGYVLIARANKKFDKLIEELPGEKKKYLSMWKGYVGEKSGAYNKELAKALGSEYEYLHTSGHCDMKSLREIFRHLQPNAIIPSHTDNPDKFAELFCDEWNIMRLHDGQSIQLPISEQ